MTRGELFRTGLIVAVAMGVTFFVVNGRETERTNVAARQVTIDACREGNLAGGYIRLVLERSPGFNPRRLNIPPPDRALPMLSCQETYEHGRPIRLRPAEERRYLRIYARGRLPLVKNGRVVGDEPLPAPPRRR